MKILSITAQNCRVHADTQISFPAEGIVGITGSNESGKSTVLEVLAWLLYGAVAVRGTMKSFRWKRAPETRKANASARLDIRGKEYVVGRSEKGANVVSEGKVLAEGQDAVTGFMTDLLGMTYEEFMVGRVCAQKEVERIASMKPAERKNFVRRLMGVGRLDDGLDRLRKRKNALSSERDGMAAGLGEREPLVFEKSRAAGQVATAETTLKRMQHELHEASAAATEAQTSLTVSEALRVKDEGTRRELEQAQRDLSAAVREIELLTGKIARAKQAEARIAKESESLARLPALREERDALRDARACADERRALEQRIAGVQDEIHGRHGILERIEDAQRQVDAFDPAALAAANERAGKADERLSALRDQRLAALADAKATRNGASSHENRLREQRASVLALGEGGPCPTCTRVLGDALQAVLDAIDAQREMWADTRSRAQVEIDRFGSPSDEEVEAEVERDDAEKEVERLRQRQQDAKLGADQVRGLVVRRADAEKSLAADRARLAELPAVTFDAARLTAIEGEVRELEVKDAGLMNDRAAAAQLPEHQQALAAATEQEESAKAGLDRIRDYLHELRFDGNAHVALRDNAARAERARQDASVAVARAEEVLGGAQAGLETARRALDEYDRRAALLVDIDARLAIYRRADVMLDQFRTAFVQQLKPEMEELVTGFVSILTDGRHEAVTLTDDFQCTLHESGVAHEVVSGGTENVAALAMRLAISQMIAERSGDAQGMLWLDEATDGIDETRRQNVLTLLRRLQGVYPQLIVSSHSPDIRESVDHVVEFEYDAAAGRSRVVSQPQLAEVA
ncbi:MAG: AAA family ATPase [Gemmatimonadales bacterium]